MLGSQMHAQHGTQSCQPRPFADIRTATAALVGDQRSLLDGAAVVCSLIPCLPAAPCLPHWLASGNATLDAFQDGQAWTMDDEISRLAL